MPISLPITQSEPCPRCLTLMVMLDADPSGLAMCCADCSSAAARGRHPPSALRRRLLAWLEERIFVPSFRLFQSLQNLHQAPNHRSPAFVPVRIRDGKKNRR